MKQIRLLLSVFLLSTVLVHAQNNDQQTVRRTNFSHPAYLASFDDPEGEFESARVVYNVTVNEQKGMRVHAKFKVRNGLDTPCRLIAYFYADDEESAPIKANDRKYRAADGAVSTHTDFTPGYDPAVYKDLQLFIPYSALNLDSGGEYDLKFYLALYDQDGKRFFGKSGYYKFRVTMP